MDRETRLALLRAGPFAWLHDPERRRFVIFLLVGGLNTMVGYGLFAGLILLGLPIAAAVLIGTTLGVLFNFLSTGTVVFRNSAARLLPRFVAVYLVQMGLNIAALHGLTALGVHPLIAGAMLILPLAAFTYAAMRRFVFPQGR